MLGMVNKSPCAQEWSLHFECMWYSAFWIWIYYWQCYLHIYLSEDIKETVFVCFWQLHMPIFLNECSCTDVIGSISCSHSPLISYHPGLGTGAVTPLPSLLPSPPLIPIELYYIFFSHHYSSNIIHNWKLLCSIITFPSFCFSWRECWCAYPYLVFTLPIAKFSTLSKSLSA